MSIDYAAIGRAGGISKGTPQKIAKAKRTAVRVSHDERESAKVRERSEGRCEVTIQGRRCPRRAFEVHHHMGGFGVRGRGESAKAKNKSHTCSQCHARITGRTLQHDHGNHYREVV